MIALNKPSTIKMVINIKLQYGMLGIIIILFIINSYYQYSLICIYNRVEA